MSVSLFISLSNMSILCLFVYQYFYLLKKLLYILCLSVCLLSIYLLSNMSKPVLQLYVFLFMFRSWRLYCSTLWISRLSVKPPFSTTAGKQTDQRYKRTAGKNPRFSRFKFIGKFDRYINKYVRCKDRARKVRFLYRSFFPLPFNFSVGRQ